MARMLVDDGAMVYVNGRAVHKFNLPGDKVYYELRPKTMMRRVRLSSCSAQYQCVVVVDVGILVVGYNPHIHDVCVRVCACVCVCVRGGWWRCVLHA